MADQIRAAIAASLQADGAFVPPLVALESVSAAQARKRVKRGLATIWEQLAHMVFWQDVMLLRMRGGVPSPVPHAADGWPKMPPTRGQDEAWSDLVAHFGAGLKEAEKIAKRAPLGSKLGKDTKRTFVQQLTHLSMHNAYHCGQIVSLRRMLGNWPPPSGGDTW